MVHVVSLMWKDGQRKAENDLGWNRDTIRKGLKELQSGFVCIRTTSRFTWLWVIRTCVNPLTDCPFWLASIIVSPGPAFWA